MKWITILFKGGLIGVFAIPFLFAQKTDSIHNKIINHEGTDSLIFYSENKLNTIIIHPPSGEFLFNKKARNYFRNFNKEIYIGVPFIIGQSNIIKSGYEDLDTLVYCNISYSVHEENPLLVIKEYYEYEEFNDPSRGLSNYFDTPNATCFLLNKENVTIPLHSKRSYQFFILDTSGLIQPKVTGTFSIENFSLSPKYKLVNSVEINYENFQIKEALIISERGVYDFLDRGFKGEAYDFFSSHFWPSQVYWYDTVKTQIVLGTNFDPQFSIQVSGNRCLQPKELILKKAEQIKKDYALFTKLAQLDKSKWLKEVLSADLMGLKSIAKSQVNFAIEHQNEFIPSSNNQWLIFTQELNLIYDTLHTFSIIY